MKWNKLPKPLKHNPIHGDLALVNLPVKVLFEFTDKIVTEWDEEGHPLEYTDGFVMKVLEGQSFVYTGQDSKRLAHINIV